MNPVRWLSTIPLQLRSLLRRPEVENELDEELRYHLERKTEEGVTDGLSFEEARRTALLELGGIEQQKEGCRDVRGVRWIEEFLQDFRFGFRLLRKSPGFSATVVLALALGLAQHGALFSLQQRPASRASRQAPGTVGRLERGEQAVRIHHLVFLPNVSRAARQNSVFAGLIAGGRGNEFDPRRQERQSARERW